MDGAQRYRVGIDVGGTFTDLFVATVDGSAESFKVLSTPEDPSIGVLDGLGAIAASRGISLDRLLAQISTIVHGTTVATNATLTRRGAKTGLITTRGVRDALEMRRGIREEQYNNRYRNVEPLVPRHLRRPVTGRLDYRGAELEPLALDEVRDAARALGAAGVTAVAICLMNSFVDGAHERAAADVVRQELGSAYLRVSSELLPTVRFYNRVSTTVLNAYVGPVVARYLGNLTRKLAGAGFHGVLLIMQSNGGVALPDLVERRPAMTLLSGPAAGPRAGAAYTEVHGWRDCIVVDMGGTSFDASLVRGGAAELATEGEIDRLRIALPMLAITTIGAGGGSIGRLDEGGLLRMGPQSAGALPGPACYGRGGELPTCTDADLLLGYLDPDYFAGGKLRLDLERARQAVLSRIAKPLGLGLEEAAAGMYRVINANMAMGVRAITVRRGLDPREFPLVVAGGAGAIHACMIADELELSTLVVPAAASTLCAAGMLLSDLQHDFARSYLTPLSVIDWDRLRAIAAELRADGQTQLALEGIPPSRALHQVSLDLRYLKQYHEVTLPVADEIVERGDLAGLRAAFHAEHNRLYGYDLAEEGTGLELINVRVRSVGRAERVALPRVAPGRPDASAARKGMRRAYVPERGIFAELPVLDGPGLRSGNVIEGPALIERPDTTIFVSASFTARIDELGSAVLERRGAAEAAHG
jgi:N-methylhydantoinase A